MKQLYKTLGLIALGILVLQPMQADAQMNPCTGDRVGIKAGTGKVELDRRECDMILLSYDRFFELEVAARQNDSLRAGSLRYIKVVNENIALRDSLNDLNRSYIVKQEQTIKDYEKLTAEYKQAAEDALDNAKFAERKLTIQKLKTPFFTIGGAFAGVMAGILVGTAIAK